MVANKSGGLAAAIAGETYTGVSHNTQDPEPIKCKWPCPTVLRVAVRKEALALREKLAPYEAKVVERIPEGADADDFRILDESDVGLCNVHRDKHRDYIMGLGFERPPFFNRLIRKDEIDEPPPRKKRSTPDPVHRLDSPVETDEDDQEP
jgi:hypothetical protein